MIQRLLVANRGEIARRIFRTCRAMTIETVAVCANPDLDEPHVAEADHAIHLPGSTPAETYLDIDAVLGAAKQSGADAIHPGYGFLAENAEFARRVLAAGLVWVGPSPEAIEIMGSKLRSKRLADEVGVPNLPSIDLTASSDEEVAAAAARLGFPVLVKASAGGGGKGMRIVSEPAALLEAVMAGRREAAASFGDDTVFLERYLEAPRHIEIQVFGDASGRVFSLHERECSIQRRHQKIIEESPSPAIDSELRRRMGETAVRLAEAAGYTGAGTVEFLFQDGEFFFLEMNTRLQVEHPVTEMVTGLDLVRLQLEVAAGASLDPVPELSGHAIEARLYAEDPNNDFLPDTGAIHRFAFPDRPGLRVDAGVDAGSMVSLFYDPMLAKVISHAPTRREAASQLARALREAVIHGPKTNRDLLVRILEDEDFLSGDVDTRFLERHGSTGDPLVGPEAERLAAAAAALADQADARRRAKVLASLPSGWRNVKGTKQERGYRGVHGSHLIRYSLLPPGVEGLGGVEVMHIGPDQVELTRAGVDHVFSVARYGDLRFVDFELGSVRLEAIPRFPDTNVGDEPGSLHAPMPGRVVRVEVGVGDRVETGQLLVVLEAMKMEHALRSPREGTVAEIACAPGAQVEAGALLVVIEDDLPPSTRG